MRLKWIKVINRYDPLTGKPWTPHQKDSRVCSEHFVDKMPTHNHPIPALNLGYTPTTVTQQPRNPPAARKLLHFSAKKTFL